MKKTTLYLPDDLKEDLRRVARETERSEAEVIRDGIRLVVSHAELPRPRAGIFASGSPSLRERMDEVMQGFGRD